MSIPKFILWDFDGTLAYRERMWSGTMFDSLREVHPESTITREQFRGCMGDGYPWSHPERPHTHITTADAWWAMMNAQIERAYRMAGLSPTLARELTARMRRAYTAPEGWAVFEDTLPTLRRLSGRGWRHHVLSNHVPELPDIAASLGLAAHIEVYHNSAVTGYEKPHAEAFQGALRALPDGAAVWMVGDNPVADIAGAEAAGIPAILVRKPDPRAQRYCESLSGVADLVESLLPPE